MIVRQVDLSAGVVEYADSQGPGPVVVLCHGLLMDRTLWDGVLPALSSVARVIAPTFPTGSHRIAMERDADLSLNGQAEILREFVETLGLTDLTLVVSDLGYPILLAAANHPAIGRLAILPSELYENIPPGLPGKVMALATRLPGGTYLAVQTLRVPGAARLPFTLGRMADRVPRPMLKHWIAGPAGSRAVRRDLAKYVEAPDFGDLDSATARLATFGRPTLILWSRQDAVMPHAHAVKLERAMSSAELVTLESGKTLLQLDRPELVVEQLARLVVS